MPNKKTFSWILLHGIAIVCVLMSLATGMRIAILSYPSLLHFSGLFPQGNVHFWHFVSAGILSGIFIPYLAKRIWQRSSKQQAKQQYSFSQRYHYWITHFFHVIALTTLISGWLMLWGGINLNLQTLHYLSAYGFIAYVLLHGGIYFIQYGYFAIKRIAFFSAVSSKHIVTISIAGVFGLIFWFWGINSAITLNVQKLTQDTTVTIDGIADEPIWATAQSIRIITNGGANFKQGSTPVNIKALANNHEIYFHFSWVDDSESLEHLPLKKTANGWQIQQDGFHVFDEQTFYEDKFAVMLSNDCELAASGTAHLGPKPMPEKPAHWTGKGYHYTKGKIVDVWHWKAVRTNNMGLADDNYFASPDIVRAGSRRYTAGYYTDAKESGSYKMNWTWYTPEAITPKRLPSDRNFLTPYQKLNNDGRQEKPNGYLAWFDGVQYSRERDTYPEGTILPSILYLSNRFEGDRAHVRAAAKWQAGQWSLEIFRKLNTRSKKDIEIKTGVCMWVAAFDHAQIAHTRHVRPIQINLRK